MLGVVTHTRHWEAEAGGSGVGDQAGLQSEMLSPKPTNKPPKGQTRLSTFSVTVQTPVSVLC